MMVRVFDDIDVAFCSLEGILVHDSFSRFVEHPVAVSEVKAYWDRQVPEPIVFLKRVLGPHELIEDHEYCVLCRPVSEQSLMKILSIVDNLILRD